jgi:hypothetical protein
MVIVDFCTNKYRLDSLFGIQFFLCHFGVNYLRSHFATVFGLLFWFWGELSAAEFCYGIRFIGFGFWGEGVGELLGYFGVGDSDDVCSGGGEAEKVDVAVPHNGIVDDGAL